VLEVVKVLALMELKTNVGADKKINNDDRISQG
jgi:hypothetical protein